MKKFNSIYLLILLASVILTSCGGASPDDYTIEDVKSTCDCVKVKTEIQKNQNDLLEAEKDTVKRKELQDSEEYEKWSSKKMEIMKHCNKNFDDKLDEVKKCPEFDAMMKELDRDHELYQSDFN